LRAPKGQNKTCSSYCSLLPISFKVPKATFLDRKPTRISVTTARNTGEFVLIYIKDHIKHEITQKLQCCDDHEISLWIKVIP